MQVHEIEFAKLFDDFQESVRLGKNPNFAGWPDGQTVVIERIAAELMDRSEFQFRDLRKRLQLEHIRVGNIIAYTPEQLRTAIIEIYAEERRAQDCDPKAKGA